MKLKAISIQIKIFKTLIDGEVRLLRWYMLRDGSVIMKTVTGQNFDPKCL